jgi:DNA-directed RNA polymerase sigma subunit (sigma70/sigma32)
MRQDALDEFYRTRNLKIVAMRETTDLTYGQIGDEFNLTPERIRQVCEKEWAREERELISKQARLDLKRELGIRP